MVKSQKKLDFWFWVKVLVVGFMLIFLFYPFCTLITRSFFSKNAAGFTLENYIRFFTKKYYYNALGRSLFVSVVTTLTTLVVGVPIAYVMSRYNVAGKRFIHIFILYRGLQLDYPVWTFRFYHQSVCKYRHPSAKHLRQDGYYHRIYL